MTLHTEDVIEDPGTLLLDVGVTAQPIDADRGRVALQELSTPMSRTGVHRLALDQVVDTLRSNPHTAVALGDEGQVIIASIRPGACSATYDSKATRWFRRMRKRRRDDGPCLQARAPWAPAVSLPVREGVASLPCATATGRSAPCDGSCRGSMDSRTNPRLAGNQAVKVIESPGLAIFR